MKALLLLTFCVFALCAEDFEITVDMLTSAYKEFKVKKSKYESYLPFLKEAMKEANIDTKLRAAHFLAQIGHESGGFGWFKEFASGKAYDITVNPKKAKELGNTQPGDGPKYKGRGSIQITGKANYKSCGEALGVDLIANPSLLQSKEYAFRAAAWFWNRHNLNQYSDADDIRKLTKKINGGYNHLADRQKLLGRWKKLLGI